MYSLLRPYENAMPMRVSLAWTCLLFYNEEEQQISGKEDICCEIQQEKKLTEV